VRNAVDHGIEPPEERVKAGKPAEGVVRLRAFHQSGSVVIEVIDDGAGISTERVLAKAIERGLVTPEQAEAMTSARRCR
jgi:two-component system chemotaxis sensor kinase CheA